MYMVAPIVRTKAAMDAKMGQGDGDTK